MGRGSQQAVLVPAARSGMSLNLKFTEATAVGGSQEWPGTAQRSGYRALL